ncbi:ABC transporter substrate-binding protein [Curvibacter sp. CHRR-16]|uniref:ABC transporter substrate-binding protein n=1 Tax=Curvibacter sp. CHRR-16 TaxID=2835872 RepID=UPI001BDAE1F8|nr:ABC transporter substrate-binding protein [Curvibacter sp. CHRR-16]MBT0569065.1 ABC transporter substrate-binding protein [Curvibacter sp. CHRR-16]
MAHSSRRWMQAALAACTLCIAALTGAHAAPTTISDVIGRQVVVDVPAKRVVLGFYIEDYFAVGGDAAYDRLVGMSLGWFSKSRPVVWKQYTEKKPQLLKVPDVGNVQDQTFSIEKVLAAKPSVVILADWQYQALGNDLARLESAGIPVVVIDFNAQTLERHVASIRVLGRITGETARAEQIARDYSNGVELMQQRIAKAKLPQPSIYIELGDKGPADYSYTYGKNMWGAMASLVGGRNIAEPFIKNWGAIHPEQFLSSNPDVVLMAGYESVANPTAMQMGFEVDATAAQKRLQGFTQRHGWSQVNAVKNQRVYGVYHGATRSILDLALMQYMAKALYPTLFKDLDPQATYLGFYQRYLPIRPSGTFMIHLDSK